MELIWGKAVEWNEFFIWAAERGDYHYNNRTYWMGCLFCFCPISILVPSISPSSTKKDTFCGLSMHAVEDFHLCEWRFCDKSGSEKGVTIMFEFNPLSLQCHMCKKCRHVLLNFFLITLVYITPKSICDLWNNVSSAAPVPK